MTAHDDTVDAMARRLARWRSAGWLRAIDLAFAGFVRDLEPALPPSLLFAAALVARVEGEGHVALPLECVQRLPDEIGPAAGGAGALPPPAEWASALSGWPAHAGAARAAWAACGAVVECDPGEGSVEQGGAPLVLSNGHLYLRRHWRDEQRVARAVAARVGVVDAGTGADLDAARTLLDRLFGARAAAADGGGADETDWQRVACALALRGRLTIVTGGPGTGKTHTAARLLVLMQSLGARRGGEGDAPLRVALAAPTGKAAARLRAAIDAALQSLRSVDPALASQVDAWAAAGLGRGRTLHALLGARAGTRRPLHDAARPLPVDLLVVDEASMVHLEMMAALLDALPPTARLVLLGDRDQLASVEAGSVLADLCSGLPQQHFTPATADWVRRATGETLPAAQAGAGGSPLAQQTLALRRSRRYAGAIGRLAAAVNEGGGAAAAAIAALVAGGGAGNAESVAAVTPRTPGEVAALAVDGRAGVPGSYHGVLAAVAQRPAGAAGFEAWVLALLQRFDALRVLCALRAGPWGAVAVNAAVEQALAARGLLPAGGPGHWYEGRPVMVTRNDAALGVHNGDVGLVLAAPAVAGGGGKQALRAWFASDGGVRSISVGRLADVETAYAMTVHKSQGSEFGHVVLVLPQADAPVLSRELLYTGITRARQALTLAAPDPALAARVAQRLTQRYSGLAGRLRAHDYGAAG